MPNVKQKMKATKGNAPAMMTGKAYDNKEAYNKSLSASARLHYLENERHDDSSPAKMYGKKKSPTHMKGSKPDYLDLDKDGNKNEPMKEAAKGSPAKMYGKKKGSPTHMSKDLSYGGPVIDQMGNALSHMGASKVLKHMKSK